MFGLPFTNSPDGVPLTLTDPGQRERIISSKGRRSVALQETTGLSTMIVWMSSSKVLNSLNTGSTRTQT
jgi:hypothetical protein